ncbi:MAG: DUF4982 domain-containing protein [Lachnospiraceae bacterium]|nr:DUF4982 domain-containing protein [Lachnospiraceae bacterium]
MIRTNFNHDWRVMNGGNSASTAAFMGTAEVETVHLPHDAMIHETRTPDAESGAQTGFYPGGEYIYQKSLTAPVEWKEKAVFLEFEGIYQTAMVYINGALAETNYYGYSNFYVKLNPWLNYGAENTIKVIADNSLVPNSRWYTGSGIYRNVKLIVGDRIHVPNDGIRITTLAADTESAIVEVETKVQSISNVRETAAVHVLLERDGETIAEDRQMVVMYPETMETARCSICVANPQLWDCEHPNLYQCRVWIECAGQVLDETTETFGIRTLTLDSAHGLRLNGKEVKLRGSCIHHDNGILGAATLEKAEERRCRQLKEAGFNSIRSSHHPLSKAMLNACDRYGIMVMDELTDMWTLRKNPYDFALHFGQCWEKVAEHMVAKDYNHPCVILYSAGNEITEAGSEAGAALSRKICNKLHELDRTRYTTMGLNGLMTAGRHLAEIMGDVMKRFGSVQAEGPGNSDGSNAFNSIMSLMEGERGEYFAVHPLLTKALEGCSSSCDIIGLNYLTDRHVLEHELHPNKTVLGTETFPADIARLWAIVKRHPHVLGDFTWTGYDYLGEAGCGIFHYDGNANFTSVYPERTAYIGDLDLIGYRRPISYLREIVYGLRKEPYLAVERLDRYGMKCSKTPWMHKDTIASWTWPGYEGKPAVVDIYADAEEVELFLNGHSLGRKPAGEQHEFTASYEITYEPGELMAVSYEAGRETGRFSLTTAGDTIHLCAQADKTVLCADGEDLSFITVNLADTNGVPNLHESKKIAVSVEGAGRLEAFGSADPQALTAYDETEWETYDGYVMAVVRAGTEEGTIKAVFTAEDTEAQCVELEVRRQTASDR